MKMGFFSSLVTSLVGCGLIQSRSETHSAPTGQDEEVSVETTLNNDKKTLEELRKNIPPERRQENDQLKEILSLMGEVKDNPSKIRERFNRTTQRMRNSERNSVQRIRKDFNTQEKKRRDEFFKKLKNDREDFKSSKNDREARKRFYEDQDSARREFNADERDKRSQFNADLKLKSDDFSAMMREKNNEFTQELRAYTQRYNDYQKELKNKKISPIVPTGAVAPLKTGDDNQ